MVNNSLSVLHGYEVQSVRDFGATSLTFDLFESYDVIGHVTHVTIRLGVGTFLLVVNDDHASIWHRYGDIKPQVAFSLC